MLPNWQPSTKRCTSSATLNTIYCPTQYAVQHATQLATKHKMLPLKHATQHTAQHDMLCNMLPTNGPKIILFIMPQNTTYCPSQYAMQHAT